MKTVLVMGASRGLGRATALRLAKAGFRIAVHYHTNKVAAQEVASRIEAGGGQAEIFAADLGKVDGPNELFLRLDEAWGGGEPYLDVLVNNAGVNLSKPFMETTG